MTLLQAFTTALIVVFTYLMAGPAFLGAPLVGDMDLHVVLLFEAVPAAMIAAWVACIAQDMIDF